VTNQEHAIRCPESNIGYLCLYMSTCSIYTHNFIYSVGGSRGCSDYFDLNGVIENCLCHTLHHGTNCTIIFNLHEEATLSTGSAY